MNRRFAVRIGLAIMLSMVAVVAKTRAQDPQPEVLWTQNAGYQPIMIGAGDLNGDSRTDVVVGISEPNITAIGSDGQTLWRFGTHDWVWQLAVGDLDGDGRDDVVGPDYQDNGYLYAVSGSGRELWRYSISTPTENLRISNVTGDSRNEVIVGDISGRLSVFDHQGAVLLTHSAPSSINAIALGDIAGDTGQEIVVSYGYRCPPCGVEVIDRSGDVVWQLSTPVRLGEAVAGDIDGDGEAEVVAGEWDMGARNVYAIDGSGSLLWTFEQGAPAMGFGSAQLALADIAGGDGLDIVLGSADQHVYVLDADGSVTWDFETGAGVSQIAVGDLDGDGRNEIAASTLGPPEVAPRLGVYAIDATGKQRWFFPKRDLSAQGFRDLVLGDVNSDGRVDVLAVQDEIRDGYEGLVFALSTARVQPIAVNIEIRSRALPHRTSRHGHGKIPVAILSTRTLDVVSELDTSSLTFGRSGDERSLAFCRAGDVNGDDLPDLLCYFHVNATGFLPGDKQGVLKGETRNAAPVQGTDSARSCW